MKERIYIRIACVVILVIVLAANLIACRWLGDKWMDYRAQQTDYPETGTYVNAELGVTLQFSDGQILLQYFDGENEPLYGHPAGRFVNDSGTFNAWYSWESGDNKLTLTLIDFPGDYAVDAEYVFTQASPSADPQT